jgi:hypothetical protein
MKSVPGKPESIVTRQDFPFGIVKNTVSCFKVKFQNNLLAHKHVFQWGGVGIILLKDRL